MKNGCVVNLIMTEASPAKGANKIWLVALTKFGCIISDF